MRLQSKEHDDYYFKSCSILRDSEESKEYKQKKENAISSLKQSKEEAILEICKRKGNSSKDVIALFSAYTDGLIESMAELMACSHLLNDIAVRYQQKSLELAKQLDLIPRSNPKRSHLTIVK